MDLIQFFLDTETTGLDQKKDSIIQLSCIVRVNGEETERHNWFMKPYKSNPVAEESTKVHGITQEQAEQFPDDEIALREFREMMDRYNLGKYDTSTGRKIKAYIVGYNVNFDLQMIKEWFEARSYFDLWKKTYSPVMDVMTMAIFPLAIKGIRPHMKDFKLVTLYKTIFNEEFEGAHNSMKDVEATVRLYDSFTSYYFPS